MGLRSVYKIRRAVVAVTFSVVMIVVAIANPGLYQRRPDIKNQNPSSSQQQNHLSDPNNPLGQNYSSDSKSSLDKNNASGQNNSSSQDNSSRQNYPLARELLEKLEVKGRAPKTGYKRTEFYHGWPDIDGCNLRQRVLKRDFGETAKLDEKCNVVAGKFYEPYTGEEMEFYSRAEISKKVQIDHVVALSDAWQKGAQYKTAEERYKIATDPLNLIAVQSAANQQKSDGDAATWLPKNKSFRCQYVARQISVKYKYLLWVSEAEKTTMRKILESCPEQRGY